jgi:hypothetical protein
MNLTKFLIAILIIFVSEADAQESSKYVGLVHPPLPIECKSDGGGLLGDSEAISFEEVSCGTAKMFWLEELVEKKSKGITWRVIDVLTIPQELNGKVILTVVDGCEYINHQDAEVVAIGRWVSKQIGGYAEDISHAWILNPHSKKIEKIPTSKVSCGYEEDRD